MSNPPLQTNSFPRIQCFGTLLPGETPINQVALYNSQRLGLQAFPVVGKAPVHGYTGYNSTHALLKPGIQDATQEMWSTATGYALMPLTDSSICFIDSDNEKFTHEVLIKFPRLRNAPQIHSGIPGHVNFIVQLTNPPPFVSMSLKGRDGHEIGSLRRFGAYILGPGSVHPELNTVYQSNLNSRPLVLSEEDTKNLLALFQPPLIPNAVRWLNTPYQREDQRAAIESIFRARGYRTTDGEWLNGRCVHPERHKNGDAHPSFGFNLESGVGKCFVCGTFSQCEIAACLGLGERSPPETCGERPVAFVKAATNLPEGAILTELNISAELIRRKKYQVARIYDVLCQYARLHDGQHTYDMGEMITFGAEYGLSCNQVKKAVAQATKLGVLDKSKIGRYRRLGIVAAQKLLGLGSDYGTAAVPKAFFSGSTGDYNQAVLIAIETRLPSGLSTNQIGAAAGRSRRTVYNHENAMGVEREASVKRVGPATAAPKSFIRIFNADKKSVVTVNGDQVIDAFHIAGKAHITGNNAAEGTVWAWSQSPSMRRVPNLHTFTLGVQPALEMCLPLGGNHHQGAEMGFPRKYVAAPAIQAAREEQ